MTVDNKTIRCLGCGKRYSWTEFLKLDIKDQFRGKTLWEVTAKCRCGDILIDKRVISCRSCRFFNRQKKECSNPQGDLNSIVDCWTEDENR